MKEINKKYVQKDLCTVLISTILHHPREGEQAMAVTNAEVIG